MVISLMAGIYQYIQVFQTELVKGAYDENKKANGHSWSEMQCTGDLCIKDSKVGIGMEPTASSKKLNVVGDIEVDGSILASGSGDICNGAGKCLSSTYQTNVMVGTNGECPLGQILIMKSYNGVWYTADAPGISVWQKITCGVLISADGTPLLVNLGHTSKNCVDAGGTVVNDGTRFFCRFNAASCSGDWHTFENWSTTTQTASGCGVTYEQTYYNCCSCAVGVHEWSNNAEVESCSCGCTVEQSYLGCSCSSARTQIGCY